MRTRGTRVGRGLGAVLVAAVFAFAGALSAGSPFALKINELNYHPASDQESLSFVELFNAGGGQIDLTGFRLEGDVRYNFGHVTVGPGAYLVVVKDLQAARSAFGEVRMVGNFSGNLGHGGGLVRLVDAGGRVVDEVRYDDSYPWPERCDGRGPSLERRSPYAPAQWADSWHASLTLNGTPGLKNSTYRALEDQVLVSQGALWRYFKGTADPPEGWLLPGFDDSYWQSGPSGFGYGDDDDATILDDMQQIAGQQDGYTTLFIRIRFTLSKLNYLRLHLHVRYDDGFVAYLNGVRVARAYAPQEPITHDMLAAGLHEAGPSFQVFDISNAVSALRVGENVLALVGFNASPDSSDFTLDPYLTATREVTGLEEIGGRPVRETVIPAGASWRYAKGTGEPDSAWRAVDFDDTAWEEGPAGFGYGDNDDATVLSDMRGNYTTVYLRRNFTIDDMTGLVGVHLVIDYDDGFVAYLNGTEVARSLAPGQPGDPVPYNATATGSHEAGTPVDFDISSALDLLVAGENCLVVIGLNSSLTSGDFSLNPRLDLVREIPADSGALQCKVRINEIAPASRGGWVELFNTGGAQWDLSGYCLSVDPRAPCAYTFPEGTQIPAGEFLLIDQAELGFELPDESSITLTDPSGFILVDSISYALGVAGASCARYPDGSGTPQVVLEATSGAPNAPPPRFGVVINEIMYHPLTPGGGKEVHWLELLNTSGQVLDLSGFRFTKGLDFEIPEGTTIDPGGFLVVSPDPQAVSDAYGISGVVGGFDGGLKNDGEVIELRDNLGNIADTVPYADDGSWPREPDGTGPSLELINPEYPNEVGSAWAASTGTGTPGEANSAFSDNPPPIIAWVRHAPLVPTSNDAVLVTCLVASPSEPVESVTLSWRRDGEDNWSEVPMADDGANGDGAAGDGIWGAQIDPQPDGTIVCFRVTVLARDGRQAYAPLRYSTDPSACLLYQVQDALPLSDLPTYRIVMKASDLAELRNRDPASDELLPATFIAGGRVYYDVGVRFRGDDTRAAEPHNFRLDFPDAERFMGRKHLDLNAHSPWNQYLAFRLFAAADVPAPGARLVRVLLNGDLREPYVEVEAVDKPFLKRLFAGDDEGNLYRGAAEADLSYLGPDKEAYRGRYQKRTKREEDDWSDLISLCKAFTDSSDQEFPSAIEAYIDVDEWLRYLAVQAVIGNAGEALQTGVGDDYFLYRRPSDGKFVIIPWDMDEAFSLTDGELTGGAVQALERLRSHPALSGRYFSYVISFSQSFLSQDGMAAFLGDIAQDIPQQEINRLTNFASLRSAFIEQAVPTSLTVELESGTLAEAGRMWRFFRGKQEPSGGTLQWTSPSFDDSSWEEGPGGFGYGDNDDATVLADMMNSYSTVYIRTRFFVEDPSEISELALSVDFDDGFVAYLNGVEIARANAPGEAGLPVPFDALATADHEAGAPVSFRIPDPQAVLVAGENVLAVQGLNVALGSSDLSLAVSLGLGSVVDNECPGLIYVAGASLIAAGTAPVISTAEVRINGTKVAFDNLTGRFEGQVELVPGEQSIVVEALDSDGLVVESKTLDLIGVSTLGGTLTGEVTLSAERSPYFVSGTVTVPAGSSLTIEPGVRFIIDSRGRFLVRGKIQALGTEEAPILFERKPCISYWGGIRLENTREDNVLQWCRISRVSAIGAVYAGSSKLTVDSCLITRIDGEGLYTPGCDLHVYNTEISYTHEAISADGCRPAVFEYLYVHNLIGKADCIDPNACHPAYIRYCLLEKTSDDGIDADRGTVEAIGNEIRNCGDQAISLVGRGNSYLAFNVLHHCNYGVALKDSHRAVLDHNTIVDNRTAGIRLYEKNAGRGGGHATVKSCIVYFNGQAHTMDDKSSITYDWCDVQIDPLPPGTRNFNEDPRFVDRAAGNYELTAASPCIGAGENGTDVGALPFGSIPLPPADLTVTGTTPTSISLAWLDVSVNEDGFELQRKGPDDSDFSSIADLPAGSTSYIDEGLQTGVVYSYRIRAYNDKGYSDWSNVVSQETGTIPRAPSDLTVTGVTLHSISLAWTDNSDDETGFEIHRQGPGDMDFRLIATVGADVTVYEDSNPPLQEGTTYRYRVRAFNSRGVSGWSNEVVQQTGKLPEAPAGLHVVSFTLDSITIAWEDRSDNETGFGIEVKIGPDGQWQPRALLAPDTTTYQDTALRSGEVYSYRVRAENEAGVSQWAGPVTQRTASVPPVPGDFSVADVGLDWILLAWEDSSDLETSYELERARVDGSFEPLATLPADTTMYADSGLTPDTPLRYRLRAVNQWGASPWTEIVTGRTGRLPETPTGLRVVSVHLTFLSLSWTDRSENERGFVIERKVGDGPWSVLIRLPADWTSYTDHGLSEGTLYSYRIKAFNRFGSSDWSEEVSAQTGSLPEAPSGLHIIARGLTFLELAWDDRSTDELYFEVEVRYAEGGVWLSAGTAPADTQVFRIRSLEPGKEYVLRVRAWNRFGPSPYSEEIAGSTGAVPPAPTDLREIAWDGSSVTLAWEDVGPAEQGYAVLRAPAEGGSFQRIAELPADTTSWTDTGLEPGVLYRYAVVSTNTFGPSELSNEVLTCAGIKILSVDPDTGSVQGGERIRIEGIHLSAGARASLGDVVLSDQQFVAGALEGVTPEWPRAESVDVLVEDGPFTSVLPLGFHYARGLLRGDANGNRFLSIADVIRLLGHLFRGAPAPYCMELGDANADGTLNLADAVFLLQYLFGSGPPPTPENVDCR